MSMIEQIENAKGCIITSHGDNRFNVNLIDDDFSIYPLHPESFDEKLFEHQIKYLGNKDYLPRHHFFITGEGFSKINEIVNQVQKINSSIVIYFIGDGGMRLNRRY